MYVAQRYGSISNVWHAFHAISLPGTEFSYLNLLAAFSRLLGFPTGNLTRFFAAKKEASYILCS
jgi:hypothetical protein